MHGMGISRVLFAFPVGVPMLSNMTAVSSCYCISVPLAFVHCAVIHVMSCAVHVVPQE